MIKYASLSLLLTGYISCSNSLLKSDQMNLKDMGDHWFEARLNTFKEETGYEEFRLKDSYWNAILDYNEFLPNLNNNGAKALKGVRIDSAVLGNKKQSLKKQNNDSNKIDDDINFLNRLIEQNKKEDVQNQPVQQNTELKNRENIIRGALNYFGVSTSYKDAKHFNSTTLKDLVALCEDKKFDKAYFVFKSMKIKEKQPNIYKKILTWLNEKTDYKYEIQKINPAKKKPVSNCIFVASLNGTIISLSKESHN